MAETQVNQGKCFVRPNEHRYSLVVNIFLMHGNKALTLVSYSYSTICTNPLHQHLKVMNYSNVFSVWTPIASRGKTYMQILQQRHY